MKRDEDEVKVFEDEKSILLDHDYDGIRELNHPLPSWWLTIFYITIVFSAIYYTYYTFLGGKNLMQEYEEDLASITVNNSDNGSNGSAFDLDKYNAITMTPESIKKGKKVFKRKCKACHGAEGEGGIGPNLADSYWLNGNGSIKDVYDVIYNGVVKNGMQAWGTALSEEEMMAVTKFVMDLKGTNPENAKEAQGTLFE